MLDVVLTIFWGIVLLSLIVVIHEGGHYLAARAFKVRVLEFMVGLPGPSIGVKRKGGQTRFGLTAIPLGGYARIAGMDDYIDESNLPRAAAFLYKYGQIETSKLEKASEVLGFDLGEALDVLVEWGTVEKVKLKSYGMGKHYRYCAPGNEEFEQGEPRTINNPEAFIAHERSETYLALPWWKRLVVCAAGPLANLLTAIIVVTLVLSIAGTYQATNTLAEVAPGGAAQAAGIEAGDTIVAVDGVAVETWTEFREAIAGVAVGSEVQVTFTRDGAEQTVTVVAQANDQGDPVIGVTAGTERIVYPVPEAFRESLLYIGQVTMAVLSLFNPATAAQTISQSTSVVGISVVARQAAELGIVNFIWLVAILSISIGLMNLLPLMPLDGGRIVVETVQRFTRKVLSPATLNFYTIVGMVFMFGLFFIVTSQDIGNIISGGFPW